MTGLRLTLAGLAVAICASAALAQGVTQPGGAQQTPAKPQAAVPQVPPFPGANSFTEEQARSRIAEAGFREVGPLRLDEQGIWRGVAQKEGQQMQVALDYEGNIVQMQ